MEILSLLGQLISTFNHLLLGKQAKLPFFFLLEKLYNSDLKRKTKWVRAFLPFKLHKEVPINFLVQSRRVRFPPCLSLRMHTFHFTGQTAASPVAYQQAGEHSLLYEVRKGKDPQWNCPELRLTPSCGAHCQFAPAGNFTLFLFLLFQHIQTLSNFMVWCIIVQCMNFPHTVEIISLTKNTQQSLLLSEWGNRWILSPTKKKTK